MENKVCLITGATSGIGKTTAFALAAQGMKLILPVRNLEKGKNIAREITAQTSNSNIELFYCDLESLDSVRAFVADFKSKYNRLNLLINNAGVWFSKRELSKDGYEKNFAVNYLALFLMTNLLLDTIRNTGHARIINLSSEAHKFSTMNFDDLMGEKSYNNFKAYGQSKLAIILFTNKLSKILRIEEATVNCLHPGVVATHLFDKMGGFMKSIFGLFMISPEKGAETTIYLATSDDVKTISGAYFKNKKVSKPRAYALNEKDENKLWEYSLKLTGIS